MTDPGSTTEDIGAGELSSLEHEGDFTKLVEPHRGELTAHCYRMLGSLHDAEDALQEVMIRAWRGIDRFEGRSSVRSWLYTIATNVCLTQIEKGKRRLHPVDLVERTIPSSGPGLPLAERSWIEPFPDAELDLPDGHAAPDSRFAQREAVEVAFIAVLQLLPPNQRAVLILRDVLGYSAKETAATLETSVASANSALQRAREKLERELPERTQQANLEVLGDDGVSAVVTAYLDAWYAHDIDGVVQMLTRDATFSMPPLDSWYGGAGGPEELREFFANGPLTGDWDWRHVMATANGQPTLAFYCWYEPDGCYRPFALNVLALDGELIRDVTCFACRSTESDDPEAYGRWPEEPLVERHLEDYFLRFGLPDRLPAGTPRYGG